MRAQIISVAPKSAVKQAGTRGNMMKRFLYGVLLLAFTGLPAQAASLVKSYSYFSIGGGTLDEIESQLSKHGPQVKSTGHRHPGATRMSFTTRFGFAEKSGSCRIVSAVVTVKAHLILPRWRRPRAADAGVKLFWDTLSADIGRHEESHVVIAKSHARELEQALLKIGNQKSCAVAKAKAEGISEKILAKHERAQAQFDKVESVNFEDRMLRLLQYRIERVENGRLPG
jgi:predicted secreted Zn-dependent protease